MKPKLKRRACIRLPLVAAAVAACVGAAGSGAAHAHSLDLSFRLLRTENTRTQIAHEQWLVLTTEEGWPTGDVRRVDRLYNPHLRLKQWRVLFAAPGRLAVTFHPENHTISLSGEIATGMRSGRPIRFEKIEATMPAGVHVVVPRIAGTAQTLYRLQPQGALAKATCFGFGRDAEIDNPLPELEWRQTLVPEIGDPGPILYQPCPPSASAPGDQAPTDGQRR